MQTRFGPSGVRQALRVAPWASVSYPILRPALDGHAASLLLLAIFLVAGVWTVMTGWVRFAIDRNGVERSTIRRTESFCWENLRSVQRKEALSPFRWFDHWEVLGARGKLMFTVPWTLRDRGAFLSTVARQLDDRRRDRESGSANIVEGADRNGE